MQKQLEQMTLAALAALYNKHAAKPVKKFASRDDALRRVRAVLPVEKKQRTIDGKRTAQLADFLAAGPRTIPEIARALHVDERGARMVIDRARRAGVRVYNVARATFSLNKKGS